MAIVVWLVTTLSLAGWWMIFGLQQLERISELSQTESTQELQRGHRMLLSEGVVLFLLILGGGVALLYLMMDEMKRSRQIREFFAAFTHDLKTSLASLRLQAETLQEDLAGSPQHARVARRLLKDSARLELQLDNSLFVADTEMGQLHISDVSLANVISGMKHYWPELEVQLQREAVLKADVRAVESIFKNLLQNAVVHGKANHVQIRCETKDIDQVMIDVHDNGKGFQGDRNRLAQIFVRHTPSSGSGIGLYISERLARQMGGRIQIKDSPNGFHLQVELPGRVS